MHWCSQNSVHILDHLTDWSFHQAYLLALMSTTGPPDQLLLASAAADHCRGADKDRTPVSSASAFPPGTQPKEYSVAAGAELNRSFGEDSVPLRSNRSIDGEC